MNVTINVDETMFKDVLEKELKAFTPEELHDIVKDMIKTYLQDSEVIKELFVTKEYDRWTSSSKFVPTEFLRKIVSNIDITNQCEEVMESVKSEITNNSREIVEELFAKAISRALADKWTTDGYMESIIMNTVRKNSPQQ